MLFLLMGNAGFECSLMTGLVGFDFVLLIVLMEKGCGPWEHL